MKFDTREKRFPRKEALYDLHSRSVNTLTPLKEILALDYPNYLDQLEDIQKVHSAYVQYKRQHNLMDYDDLLVNFAVLLKSNDSIRALISDQHKYVMVDEYQDTNRVQAEIVKLLAFKHQNVMVVGDDAQSIYSFRGSTIRNILEFEQIFRNCTVVKLEENYRSTQPILMLANEILNRGSIR
jgi:DNA helicase-2/ATP-dependent DNA helicase PcrA